MCWMIGYMAQRDVKYYLMPKVTRLTLVQSSSKSLGLGSDKGKRSFTELFVSQDILTIDL